MKKKYNLRNEIPDDNDSSEVEDENQTDAQTNAINSLGTPVPNNTGEGPIYCLSIIGQIEGHYILPANNKTTKYEHIIPILTAAEQSKDIKGILILLNTVGGDVEAGLAIAELISGMSKPTVSLVLGGGHSIGVPLAVASNYSFIVPSATMTVHPVRLNGTIIGVSQTFSYFLKMQDRIINFIVTNSKAKPKVIKELMLSTDEMANDMGTILDGPRAVSYGFINEIGGLKDALAKLNSMILETNS